MLSSPNVDLIVLINKWKCIDCIELLRDVKQSWLLTAHSMRGQATYYKLSTSHLP